MPLSLVPTVRKDAPDVGAGRAKSGEVGPSSIDAGDCQEPSPDLGGVGEIVRALTESAQVRTVKET